MRVITFNLNGIRSAARKGWLDWMATQQADLVCVQETRAQDKDLGASMRLLQSACGPMLGHFHFAVKPGYAGTGIYSARPPLAVHYGFGEPEFDSEGRYTEVDLGDLVAISLYVPSGSASEEKLQAKFRFMRRFSLHLANLLRKGRPLLICADWNVAHREIDLRNWRANQTRPGFLPEERAWIDSLIHRHGMVDVFRRLEPDRAVYTWWSNRGAAFVKNVGWRIDYQLATPDLAERATGWYVQREPRFSDHAPLIIDYALDLVPYERAHRGEGL
jgi:exodeoxyribonuclease-3